MFMDKLMVGGKGERHVMQVVFREKSDHLRSKACYHLLGNDLAVSNEVKYLPPYDSAMSFWREMSTYVHRMTCTRMFMTTVS